MVDGHSLGRRTIIPDMIGDLFEVGFLGQEIPAFAGMTGEVNGRRSHPRGCAAQPPPVAGGWEYERDELITKRRLRPSLKVLAHSRVTIIASPACTLRNLRKHSQVQFDGLH